MMLLFDGIEKFLQADFLKFTADFFFLNILCSKGKVQLKDKEGNENYFQKG